MFGKAHHISQEVITNLVRRYIVDIVCFTKNYGDKFVKIVVNENYKPIIKTHRRNEFNYESMLSRDKKVNEITENLYKEKALVKLKKRDF